MTRNRIGILSLALYVGSIFLANFLIHRYGLVGVGFGLMVPAGTFAAGVAFTARDVVQETLGRWWTIAAILVGAALSAVISPQLAVASGSAFLLGEALDMVVFSHLRDRQWDAAVWASGLVGATADSLLFLRLAGFPHTPRDVFALVACKLVVVGIAWALWRPARHRVLATA